MNNDNRDKVVPLIVNGEINDGRNKRNKQPKEEKLPTKRFTFTDFILCVIAVFMIYYGVKEIINNNKKTATEEEAVTSNVEEKSTKKSLDYKKAISYNSIEISNIYTTQDLINMNNGLDVNNLSNNAKLSMACAITNKYSGYILEDDLDNSMKKLFGDISYVKDEFMYGNNSYTYNKETKRYYLKSNDSNNSPMYTFNNYVEEEKNDTGIIIKNYILYSSNDKKWTLNNIVVDSNINSNNIKDNKDKLKYFEYSFVKNNDEYILKSITIK